ncbi:MAG: RagB/SusD family nutrient uptake outer membrane protein, partial [Chitinophagaceae bacterium]|nr:RagB/SusD family nutrient uptake outer membrane protein [Chitinophagaceae bacterium]
SGDVLQFYTNAVSPTENSIVNGSFWQHVYVFIYRANACIEGLQTASNISTWYRDQLLGEAKFMRAFCYFNLVNLFGDVPLAITTNYEVNRQLSRSNKDSVYRQITNDLVDAAQLMQANYITSGRFRPNKYTAMALLAKVYLYTGQWLKAEGTSSQIINSGIYSLQPLNSVFVTGSNEAIWQLLPLHAGFETAEGWAFIPRNVQATPAYIISSYLFNSFEPGDNRKTNWLKSNTVNGVEYFYPYKYKLGRDNNTSPLESNMIFRLGEQFLIRAESRAQQGNISGLNSAEEDLNEIRGRAGLNDTAVSTSDDILALIGHERRVELFCEWGNRWYDIKRTGKADAVMQPITQAKGGTWNSSWQVFPIPFAQIAINPALKQNKDY